MEVPSAVGGQPQCAAEPGPGGGCCAGLHAVLQSHGLLQMEGIEGLPLLFCLVSENPDLCAVLSLSVCFEISFPLADPEILCSTHPALPYLALLNNKLLKIKG